MKQIKDLAIGDLFTDTPDIKTMYYVERRIDDELYLCRDTKGWGRCFAPTDTVYCIGISSLDGTPYRMERNE